VLYGWLSLDITDRIKKHASLSPAGLSAKNIELPQGEHTIKIRIRDSKGRQAEKDFSFTVS